MDEESFDGERKLLNNGRRVEWHLVILLAMALLEQAAVELPIWKGARAGDLPFSVPLVWYAHFFGRSARYAAQAQVLAAPDWLVVEMAPGEATGRAPNAVLIRDC